MFIFLAFRCTKCKKEQEWHSPQLELIDGQFDCVQVCQYCQQHTHFNFSMDRQLKGKTDWERLKQMTDAEIEAKAASDPDNPPTTSEFWKGAKVTLPKWIEEVKERWTAYESVGVYPAFTPDVLALLATIEKYRKVMESAVSTCHVHTFVSRMTCGCVGVAEFKQTLAEARKKLEWLPISEAPLDETTVDLWVCYERLESRQFRLTNCHFCPEEKKWLMPASFEGYEPIIGLKILYFRIPTPPSQIKEIEP